jgi:hypothetical protein
MFFLPNKPKKMLENYLASMDSIKKTGPMSGHFSSPIVAFSCV